MVIHLTQFAILISSLLNKKKFSFWIFKTSKLSRENGNIESLLMIHIVSVNMHHPVPADCHVSLYPFDESNEKGSA